MKKIKLFLCSSLFLFNYTHAQQWLWGRQGDSAIKSNDNGSRVACDKAGSAYITGWYDAIISFNSHLLDDSGSIYMVKYDKSGNLIWAQRPLGYGYGSFDATDNFGNVFFTGNFSSSIGFSHTVGLSGAGTNVYLAK